MYEYCEGTDITADAFPASPRRLTACPVCKNVICDPVTVREYPDISPSVQNPPNYPISQICTDGLVHQSPNLVPSSTLVLRLPTRPPIVKLILPSARKSTAF